MEVLSVQFSRSVVSDSLWPPWTVARQASLSNTNSWSLFRLMSIESVMPSNHLILCHPLLLPPSTFPIIRIFSNDSVLHIRWPKYQSFSFSISPSNEYSGLISLELTDWSPCSISLILFLISQSSWLYSTCSSSLHPGFGLSLMLLNDSFSGFFFYSLCGFHIPLTLGRCQSLFFRWFSSKVC